MGFVGMRTALAFWVAFLPCCYSSRIRNQLQRPSGGPKSASFGQSWVDPLNHSGGMTKAEQQYLYSWYSKARSICELGVGSSTIMASTRQGRRNRQQPGLAQEVGAARGKCHLDLCEHRDCGKFRKSSGPQRRG
ncbi:unnamed protein product [Amoebophrya sp. A25]|nr:unnamed protein product [Amoebophrya sp. A25]|eukprot:GSA25T00023707001.1